MDQVLLPAVRDNRIRLEHNVYFGIFTEKTISLRVKKSEFFEKMFHVKHLGYRLLEKTAMLLLVFIPVQGPVVILMS